MFALCPWCHAICYLGTHGASGLGLFGMSRKIVILYHGSKQICFIPMPMDVFAADWKDRLRKRREEVEEIKEVDASMKGLNLLVKKVQEKCDPKGQR